MRYILTVFATLLILGHGALLFPYTGWYNVSATNGHTDLTHWYLSTLSTHSIQAYADGIAVPTDLGDSASVARGAVSYAQMCQTCHGGPGQVRSVTGDGLTPMPPDLGESVGEWAAHELFWILDNGIKMTGMPAYGPTHTDEELWEIVAFVQQLPETTPEQYLALTAPPELNEGEAPAVPPGHEGHDHVH